MNLIPCSKDCRYQRDGYCARTDAAVTGTKVDGCCYYQPAGGEPRPQIVAAALPRHKLRVAGTSHASGKDFPASTVKTGKPRRLSSS